MLGLIGCTQQIYYRAGADVTALQRAQDACALRAQEEAPYRPQTRILPPRIIPAQKVCDAQGNCQVIPATQGFPEFETVDANKDRRALIARQCLAEQGIDRVSLPYCSSVQRATVTPGITRVLPVLSETSCLIPRGNGAYQIVP